MGGFKYQIMSYFKTKNYSKPERVKTKLFMEVEKNNQKEKKEEKT